MKYLIYFVSLILFLRACNNLANVASPAAVTPAPMAILILETAPTAVLSPSLPQAQAAETEPAPTVLPPLSATSASTEPFARFAEVSLRSVDPVGGDAWRFTDFAVHGYLRHSRGEGLFIIQGAQ